MQPKFESGDLVIIHQDPRFLLPDNLLIYHGRKAKVICEAGKSSYVVEIPEGSTFVTKVIPAQNLVLHVKLKTITALVALDERMSIVAVREYPYGSPPTKKNIYKFLEETNAKFIDVRILYTFIHTK